MEISENHNDNGILALSPQGDIDSQTARDFEDHVIRHIDKGSTSLIVDFSAVDYINSAGLRVLLLAAKRLKKEGGRFAISAPGEKIMEILKVSGFVRILDIYDHTDQALAAWS